MKFKKLILGVTSILILTGCSTSNNLNNQILNETKNISNEDNDKQVFNKNISVASVSIAQVLDKMNQDIVGRPTTKIKLPERYEQVQEIGSSFSPDFEKVISVGTELLIADLLFKDKIEKTANEYNIETFYVDTSTYKNYIDSIYKLGEKINKQTQANSIIEELKKPLNEFNTIDKNLKIAIIFGSSESNMLATEDTYIGSLIKEFNVSNIANEIIKSSDNILEANTSGYINLNLEQLLKNQPDLIFRFGHGSVEEANKNFEKLFSENPAWSNLNAIKNNKIYDLDANIFGVSANLKMGDALSIIGEILNEN